MAARFWVAGGTGDWSSTTNWSATTGGASGASVPGSADTATFNASSGAGTATVNSSVTIQTLTMTGFTGTLAFGTNTISLNSTGAIFVGDTTYNVTGTPLIKVITGGSVAIQLNAGNTTEANSISYEIIGGTYGLSISNICRDLTFTGYSGSAGISVDLYGNLTLSSTMTVSSSSTARIGFIATSGVKTITTNGLSFGRPIVFNGVGGTWQLQDALTTSAIRTVTLTNGTLDLNNKTITAGFFSSDNANARTLAFGSGNIVCNGAGGTLWTTATPTNLTVSGTPTINITYSGAVGTTILPGALTEAQAVSFNFTAGTYALVFLATTSYAAKNVDFTGFAGTWNARTAASTIYGNLTFSTGMTFSASSGVLTFRATSGTQILTSNGKTIDEPLTLNGVGGTLQLADALLMGTTRAFRHTNGTLDLNAKTLTVGTDYTTVTGTKNLTFNAGTLVCPDVTTTAFNNAAPTGFTTTAGTGTGKISMTGATAKTFVGGGATYNCTLSNDGAGALTVSGSNTFTTIANGVQPTAFTFTAATTQTVTNWNVSGTAGNLVTIISSTAAVPALLSKASGTVSSNYLSLKDSTALGGATWYAGANSTNVSGNLGWLFSAAPVDISVSATGISSIGSVGTTTVVTDANVSLTGLQATGSVGTTTVATDANVSLTGLQATGSVGTTTVATDANVSLTGLQATGSVGTTTVATDANVDLTGVAATGSTGTVTVTTSSGAVQDAIVAFEGWGRSWGWGLGPFGSGSIDIGVASGQVGSVSLVYDANVDLTGVAATGSVGTTTVTADANVNLTGLQATGSVGTTTVTADANVNLTGLQATGSVGTTTVTADANVNLTGLQATGSVGTTTVTADANVSVTGVQANGAVGTVEVSFPTNVSVDGVSATGGVGSASVLLSTDVHVAGVSATGYVGVVLIWGQIVPDQNQNWMPVSPSQTPAWTQAVPSQVPVWTQVSPAQSPAWTPVSPSQNPGWTPIAA